MYSGCDYPSVGKLALPSIVYSHFYSCYCHFLFLFKAIVLSITLNVIVSGALHIQDDVPKFACVQKS